MAGTEIDYWWRAGERGVFEATLYGPKPAGGTAAVLDLTGATVRFRIREQDAASFLVDSVATIVSPSTSGKVKYQLTSGEAALFTTKERVYWCEWQHIPSSGIANTVPTETPPQLGKAT
jgi:hypothetical protein